MLIEKSLAMNILVTIMGTVFGGIISACVTWIFYRKSSENLRKESEALRKINEQEGEMLGKLTKALKVAHGAKKPVSQRTDGNSVTATDNITVLILNEKND